MSSIVGGGQCTPPRILRVLYVVSPGVKWRLSCDQLFLSSAIKFRQSKNIYNVFDSSHGSGQTFWSFIMFPAWLSSASEQLPVRMICFPNTFICDSWRRVNTRVGFGVESYSTLCFRGYMSSCQEPRKEGAAPAVVSEFREVMPAFCVA